ncbi:hypothetical protein [Actinacidiphila sp. ITFR-21]|uniref:hypothetical protein n=1 Tax=Actinacidiphila sp. ITFR-21 TaxID=3075199 RepID=UPI00288B34AC|nr:hypothetical protein [Streptomyces sp. ITFR-21]WNI16645.1 hypothetical protein RLT57_14735 [Streptomyces sp. ITFR-21]
MAARKKAVPAVSAGPTAAEKNPTGRHLMSARPLSAAERRECVRQAAAHAVDGSDLRYLLAVLGLTAQDAARPAPQPPRKGSGSDVQT